VTDAQRVHRPPRAYPPLIPIEPEMLATPPAVDVGTGGSHHLGGMLPMAGSLLSVVSIVLFRIGSRVFLVLGAALLAAVLVAVLVLLLTRTGKEVRRRRAERERYLDYLESVRVRMRARRRERREEALLTDPAPDALYAVLRDPARIWERRRRDADFLRVRVGEGALRVTALGVPPEPDPLRPHDPSMLAEARAVAERCPLAAGMPLTLELDGAEQVALVGERRDVLDSARALVAQLVSWHAPDDVCLALLVPENRSADWSGVDRLPHLHDDTAYDGLLPARRLGRTMTELATVLEGELASRVRAAAGALSRSGSRSTWTGRTRLVVVLDTWGEQATTLALPEPGFSLRDLGVTLVHLVRDRLDEPSELSLRVAHAEGQLLIDDLRTTRNGNQSDGRRRGVADRCSLARLDALGRTLAGRRLSRRADGPTDLDEPMRVTDLLGIDELDDITPARCWQPRPGRDFLRVPIGVGENGAPLMLDLKESAHHGMGPHGICVGATGSGKSEMLRTLVTSLSLTHAPEDLAMVLVDYKGGAAFAPCAGLPQVAGIIDNLADDPQLTERARTSINGELVRRQLLLKRAGMCPSIGEYRELRRTDPALPVLPHLLLVIDEFGELLTADPEFIDVLITIGRIGRSIGVHLLLSSQRVEMGKLRGLETYLSYRIGLRTFSESESSSILGTPDAFHLPSAPGFGYLKVDTTTYTRFRAGFVSGPVETGPRLPSGQLPEPFLVAPWPVPSSTQDPTEPEAPISRTTRSLLAECVERLTAADRRVRPVWLDPLGVRLPLLDVLARSAAGVVRPGADGDRRLALPIGVIDDPATQTQDIWRLDLSRAGGHVAVIGAPQSGRTTLLRTIAVSAALTRTPAEVGIYGIDLSGGGLGRISGFPHVGAVATRSQPERLTRLLDELGGMLSEREAVFREHGLDSLDQLRREHAAGRIPELESAEIVLLVDGFAQLRGEFESLEPAMVELLQRGGSFGIHLVIALARWNDLRMTHQPFVGTHLELHLNDPGDSCIARKLVATIPGDQPGRALTDEQLFAQVALSATEHAEDGRSDGELVERLADRIGADWTGVRARPVRVLPEDLGPGQLPSAVGPAQHLVLGLRQDTMAPAVLELGARDQHLLVFGDQGCGKTTVLRGIVQELVSRHSPDELVFAVMDLRGEVLDAVPADYLGAHARTATQARQLGEAVARDLAARPAGGSAGTAGRARVVVLADDYDMIASTGADPLRPLVPHLASARDLRLHVVLARPVAGAVRAMFDHALQSVRDTGGSALIMSGERTEGQILPQTYAEQMPPGRGRFLRRGEPAHIVQVANFTTRVTR
jgi:DNA segregation ATPase FtsK/SpoIIIE, S-DNA-T family